MPSDFDKDFHRYAELIAAHGLNVQQGQLVHIQTEPIHRDFALLVGEKCYARGAKFVDFMFHDPRAVKLRVDHSDAANLTYVPGYITSRFTELVDVEAAHIGIIGLEYPDLLAGANPKLVQTAALARQKAIKYFFEDGVGKAKVHWCIAAAATPLWGKKVFPELAADEAGERLWKDILAICRADKPACLDLWKEHDRKLQARAKALTDMKIRELRFVGPGTDLVVGLNERAIWKGGQEVSPKGRSFEANLPSEEVFTTPDFRATRGHVRTTRPFMIHGKMIEGLSVKFDRGVIADFRASNGSETFGEYIKSDEGAARLGEVALVGIDSPIYQTGRIYQEILFDENAACHIAVGQAYKFCLRDGTGLSREEALALGCNESAVHTDMMISSEDVDVTATLHDGTRKSLIQAGAWTREFC